MNTHVNFTMQYDVAAFTTIGLRLCMVLSHDDSRYSYSIRTILLHPNKYLQISDFAVIFKAFILLKFNYNDICLYKQDAVLCQQNVSAVRWLTGDVIQQC